MSDLRRVPSSGAVEVGYPTGHLGHLTEHETQALADFKVLLEEKGFYKPGPPPSHDDPTLLRTLRARKWVPQDAYVQFSETEKFRNANEIETLYHTIDITSTRVSPDGETSVLTSRRRRRSVADYEKSTETTYSKAKTDGKTPPKLLRLFALYENLTRFVQPLSSECVDRENPETPITLSTNIVDISHVSLRMFWNLKAHMQAASQLATAHYPETLDRIFIIGAPYFFSTVWGWIKRWFDPVTVSKIFILSDHDVLPVLTTFMDLEDIPKNYGGKLEWSFFDEPAYDDEIKRIPTEDGTRLECLAVGSKDGQERKERVCTVPKAFPPKSTTATGTSETNGDKEEASATTSEEAAIETTLNEPLARPENAEASTLESTADAVAGLAITDTKDSTEQLSEKVASAIDVATETKAQ
ncbi:hypothetical protein GQX73_g9242 [Xylaria multiplex]|uniref:CRAL-TRIO domain-containing protein n=1 Tax=Xylaria multiplex TaxID=323545 RepID=A0A7C8II86_9PEZI|nr:hypothetical protein GQX73_g9242 [Xylaria multiplex]